MAGFEETRFEIGGVVSRTFGTIGANAPLFVGLALILTGPPAVAMQLWQAMNFAFGSQPDPAAVFTLAYFGPISVGWLVATVSGAVLQAALTRATVTHLSGEKPNFMRCLMVGLTMILPMIGIGVLMMLGVFFAMLFLIVPGIILWLCWSVVVPVYVQEKVGFFEAFGRSLELTRGWRWRIFLTMLLLVILAWLFSVATTMLTAAVHAAIGSIFVTALIGGGLAALSSMVMVTAQASIYIELRNVKEGVAPADLEAIFA